MLWTRSSIARRLRAIISLALALMLFVSYPSQALALRKNRFQLAYERILSIFNPRTSQGAPVGRARGAAGRGRCPALASIGQGKVEVPLTALMPKISNSPSKAQSSQPSSSQIVWGVTIEADPTLWFYIPYPLEEQSELKFAKFVLLNEERNIVAGPLYFKLPTNGKPSIVGFTLPNHALKMPGLAINKPYNWYFSLICNARKPSKNPSVTGWIERISPQPIPKGDLDYIEQGIWYDLVTRTANRIVENSLVTAQTQSEAVPLSPKPLTTALQSQIQNPIQEDWVELFQFLVQNLDLTTNNSIEIPLHSASSLDTISGTTEVTQEEKDKIADELAQTPVFKLIPIPESKVQLQ